MGRPTDQLNLLWQGGGATNILLVPQCSQMYGCTGVVEVTKDFT